MTTDLIFVVAGNTKTIRVSGIDPNNLLCYISVQWHPDPVSMGALCNCLNCSPALAISSFASHLLWSPQPGPYIVVIGGSNQKHQRMHHKRPLAWSLCVDVTAHQVHYIFCQLWHGCLITGWIPRCYELTPKSLQCSSCSVRNSDIAVSQTSPQRSTISGMYMCVYVQYIPGIMQTVRDSSSLVAVRFRSVLSTTFMVTSLAMDNWQQSNHEEYGWIWKS